MHFRNPIGKQERGGELEDLVHRYATDFANIRNMATEGVGLVQQARNVIDSPRETIGLLVEADRKRMEIEDFLVSRADDSEFLYQG